MNLLRKKQQSQPQRRRASSVQRGQGRGSEVTPLYADRYTYRRNRTLTGSLSSDVASVNEHRAEFKSPRVQSHQLRQHRRRLTGALLGVSVVALVLLWVVWHAIATVQIKIAMDGARPTDTQVYVDAIQRYLTSHPLERTTVTVNTETLTAAVQHELPEVKAITLKADASSFGTGVFSVTMRQPVVSWQTGSTRLYVDTDGVSFTRNYYHSPSVEVVDETGIQAVNNRILASSRFLGFIGLTIGQFASQGLTVAKVTLPVDTTHQLLVSVTSVSYAIKVNTDRSAAHQAEDAARSIRYLEAKGIVPRDYVDVRVSGRAFYK